MAFIFAIITGIVRVKIGAPWADRLIMPAKQLMRTHSLRTGRSPHPCILCLLPADVCPALCGSVSLPAAVVISPGRQIEPNHYVCRAVLVGFLLGCEVRRRRGRRNSHTQVRPQ